MNQSSTIEPIIHKDTQKIATPHLTMRRDFELALKDYHMNPEAERTLAETPFVTMSGPTATGRNTIINELVKTGHYYFIVSDTTRPKRFNDGVFEKNGVEYFFRSEADVLVDIKNGRYIEAEIIHDQQVSGQSIREVEEAHRQGKIAINEIEILGSLNMARRKPDTTSIILLPPSFDEWQRRLHQRTKMEPLELHRRMKTALHVLKAGLENDFFIFVINDDLTKAVKAVDDLARLGIHHRDTEAKSRALAQQLYDQTYEYLHLKAPDILVI